MGVTPQQPYPVVETVMRRSRAYVNDAYGGTGRILTDQAPFTVEYLNGALENLQDKLRDYESITLIRDNFILTPVTPAQKIDPSVQVNISFIGYFDGTTTHKLPALPGDMLSPIYLWERQTGSGLPFEPMRAPQGGLYSDYQGATMGWWEWRGDALWMIGCTSTVDLRLRYQAQLQPITPSTAENPWTDVSVVINASTETMALLVAYRYARARGGQGMERLKPDADEAMRSLLNRYVLASQGTRYERQAYERDDYGYQIPGVR
jgi:hypothetical protein